MIALSLAKYWKIALIALLVGALVVSCHERDQALIEKGRVEEQLKALTAKTHRDSVAGALADATVRRDTVVLTQWLTKYDTVRHRVNIHDTVEIKTYIATADSTIKSCRQTVLSLTTSCQRKDTIIADLTAKLAVHAPPKASLSQRVLWGLGGLAVGLAAERALTH